MEFEQWLSNRPRADVAAELGVHRMTVNRYARGQIMPRPDMVEAIGRLTSGLVGVVDLTAAYNRYHAQ
jgi:transcriptional regulator with XRE-family HTH domain